jgi:hypothetical protein
MPTPRVIGLQQFAAHDHFGWCRTERFPTRLCWGVKMQSNLNTAIAYLAAFALAISAAALLTSAAVAQQGSFRIENPNGPAYHCIQTQTGTYCPDGGGGTQANRNGNYDDDGAPCRGGWMHGPIWDAILGRCSDQITVTPNPPAPAPNYTVGSIFPDSSSRYLDLNDLHGKTLQELRVARNEMFARKGRYFKDAELRVHFESLPWYRPYTWDVSLNPIELANIKIIQQAEAKRDSDEPSCLFDVRGGCRPVGTASNVPAPSVDFKAGWIGGTKFSYPVIPNDVLKKLTSADRETLKQVIEQRGQAELDLPNAQRAYEAAKANPVNHSPQGQAMVNKLDAEVKKNEKTINDSNAAITNMITHYVHD